MADSKYQRLHDRYISKMSSLKDQKEMSLIAESLKNGKTHVMRMKRLESSSFDMSWINAIEDCIFDLGTIVKNPKRTTKTVSDVVPIELARKIGAESVQHLSSHSNLIKEIDEKGNVVPSKILNLASDDDYATYENRFIATLIRRLILFIEKRYDYVMHFAPLNNAEVMYLKNKSVVDGMEVEIETKVKVLRPVTDNITQSNDYINRILEIRKYLRFYYNSEFMKMLKTERDVRNPILQTNIIRKNPEYNHCYRLFRFIEHYDRIGVSYKVKETYSTFDDKDFEELNSTLLASFLALKPEDPSQVIKESNKQYKPKILTSIDDEQFAYGPLVRGPVQFVRMDQEYLDYMSRKIPLPQYMNNHERVYYEDEISANREQSADLKQLELLIRRKKAEFKNWEKFVAISISEREKEEEIKRRLEEISKLQAEEARLQAARERLAMSALEGQNKKVEIEESINEKDIEQEQKELAEKARIAQEKAEAERKAAEEAAAKAEAEAKAKAEEERKAKAEAERLAREEAARKAEEERLAKEEADRKAAEEAAAKAEAERIAKEEAEKKAAEEAAALAEAERIAKEEAAKKALEEKKAREEARAIKRAEAEAKRKELEAKRRARERAKRKAEKEKAAREEAKRLRDEEKARKAAEKAAAIAEAERKAAEEAATKAEAERLAALEAAKKETEAKKAAAKKPVHKEKAVEQKIPGVFIVKTNQGYYVGPGKFSEQKSDAKIIYDFNEARHLKEKFGGKVVKILN